MSEVNDMDLLGDYATNNSEAAFAEIVHRHINMVYSVALRYVGSPADAQDVSQAVFVILAQKSARLSSATILTGWLYETTRFTAMQSIRARGRRAKRDQEAFMRSTLNESSHEDIWRKTEPLLEEAMSCLNAKERSLIVLRYFEGKSFQETATAFGIAEWAARKRSERAVEKLRRFLTKRGVVISSVVLTAVIASNSVQAAPPTLATVATAIAITRGAASSTSTSTLIKGAFKIMAWSKAKMAIVIGVSALLVAGTTTVAVKTNYLGEPRYEGKTLNVWLEESKNAVLTPQSDTADVVRKKALLRKKAFEAVQHIGPRAIPTLLKWVENTTNGGGHILAAGCIEKLGPSAKEAVPGLIRMLNSTNEMQRYASLNALQRIGPAADSALPAILDHIQHDPSWIRGFSITTLANSGIGKSDPYKVVPILVDCLEDPNVRGETLRALGSIGTQASNAVLSIQPYLEDSNPDIRKAAANALNHIAPSRTDKPTG